MGKHRKYNAKPVILVKKTNDVLSFNNKKYEDMIYFDSGNNKYYFPLLRADFELIDFNKMKPFMKINGNLKIENIECNGYRCIGLDITKYYNKSNKNLYKTPEVFNCIRMYKLTLNELFLSLMKDNYIRLKNIMIFDMYGEPVLNVKHTKCGNGYSNIDYKHSQVPLAPTDESIRYCILTRIIKILPMKMLEENIDWYIDKDFNLRIKVFRKAKHKKYRQIVSENGEYVYKKLKLNKISHKPSKATLAKLKEEKKQAKLKRKNNKENN